MFMTSFVLNTSEVATWKTQKIIQRKYLLSFLKKKFVKTLISYYLVKSDFDFTEKLLKNIELKNVVKTLRFLTFLSNPSNPTLISRKICNKKNYSQEKIREITRISNCLAKSNFDFTEKLQKYFIRKNSSKHYGYCSAKSNFDLTEKIVKNTPKEKLRKTLQNSTLILRKKFTNKFQKRFT